MDTSDFGYLFRKHIGLSRTKSDKYIFVVTLIIFAGIEYIFGSNNIEMIWNKYEHNYILTLIQGISGSLCIIYLCKLVKYLPIVSYIGRYSLIALSMHTMLIPFIKVSENSNINLLLLVLVLCPVIYLFKKFLPRLCAQKPFIKFDPDRNKIEI